MNKAMDMLTRQHASASVRALETIDFEANPDEIEKLHQESMSYQSGAQAAYSAVPSTSMHEYKVETERKATVSAGGVYTGVAATTVLTILMGPVGLAIGVGGMGAGYGYSRVTGSEDVVLPPPIPRLGPPKKWVKCVFVPLAAIMAALTLAFDIVLQFVSLLSSCIFAFMLSYIIYFFLGETVKISRVAFSYSRLYTEIVITGVVVANPDGPYQTPFFLTLDRVEVHLPIMQIIMTLIRSLRHEDGKLEGLIKVPYLMVNELQIFFEKPEQKELETEVDYTIHHLNALKMIGVGGDPESKAALWANLNALFDKLCLLIWDLGDIELRQITVFATDLVADLLGCEYGVGLAKCVHAPIKIDAFTIRHDDERLHPDKKKTMDKTGARPPPGLITAQLFEQFAKILAKSVDINAAISLALASQTTYLGGEATVTDANEHFRRKLRETASRSVRAHQASVSYTGHIGDVVVSDMHDAEEGAIGSERAAEKEG